MDANSDNDAGFQVGRRRASPYVFQLSQVARSFTLRRALSRSGVAVGNLLLSQ